MAANPYLRNDGGNLAAVLLRLRTEFPGNYRRVAAGINTVFPELKDFFLEPTTANGGGFVSFNFYVVNSSTVLVLETDNNQIGSGIFQFQTAPSGQVAQSHVALAHVPIRSLEKRGTLHHK